MTAVGQIEKKTRSRVVALFQTGRATPSYATGKRVGHGLASGNPVSA